MGWFDWYESNPPLSEKSFDLVLNSNDSPRLSSKRIELLPRDLLLLCFSFLPHHEARHAFSVCHTWSRLSKNETLWRSLFQANKQVSSNSSISSSSSRQQYWKARYRRYLLTLLVCRDCTKDYRPGERDSGRTFSFNLCIIFHSLTHSLIMASCILNIHIHIHFPRVLNKDIHAWFRFKFRRCILIYSYPL